MQPAQFLGSNLQSEELLRSDMQHADFLKSELPDLQLKDFQGSDLLLLTAILGADLGFVHFLGSHL